MTHQFRIPKRVKHTLKWIAYHRLVAGIICGLADITYQWSVGRIFNLSLAVLHNTLSDCWTVYGPGIEGLMSLIYRLVHIMMFGRSLLGRLSVIDER